MIHEWMLTGSGSDGVDLLYRSCKRCGRVEVGRVEWGSGKFLNKPEYPFWDVVFLGDGESDRDDECS